MKQTDRLLHYLHHHRSINPLQSWAELGIYRLASRVCDLRKEGWQIEKRMVKICNRFNEPVKFAEYRLVVERNFDNECYTQEDMI